MQNKTQQLSSSRVDGNGHIKSQLSQDTMYDDFHGNITDPIEIDADRKRRQTMSDLMSDYSRKVQNGVYDKVYDPTHTGVVVTLCLGIIGIACYIISILKGMH